MNLQGKTALITGGAVRLGRVFCEVLAARGCNIVVHCRRSHCEAKALVQQLSRTGVRTHTVRGDVRSPAGCRDIVRQAFASSGRIDILINNAAVFSRTDFRKASERETADILSVNLLGPLWLTRAWAARAREGKVVNLLDSQLGGQGYGGLAYLLSKKALADLTRLLARELAPGIAVNGLAPGAILGPPTGAPSRARAPHGRFPLGRAPSVTELAGALVFLLSNDAVTGQVLTVDGGQHLLGGHAP